MYIYIPIFRHASGYRDSFHIASRNRYLLSLERTVFYMMGETKDHMLFKAGRLLSQRHLVGSTTTCTRLHAIQLLEQ